MGNQGSQKSIQPGDLERYSHVTKKECYSLDHHNIKAPFSIAIDTINTKSQLSTPITMFKINPPSPYQSKKFALLLKNVLRFVLILYYIQSNHIKILKRFTLHCNMNTQTHKHAVRLNVKN